MPVRQRGNSWQVDVRKKGIRFRHTYQTEDQANQMLVKVETAISRGAALPDPNDCFDGKAMTIGTLFRKAGTHYWDAGRPEYRKAQFSIMNEIIGVIGSHRPLTELNPNLLDELIAHWRNTSAREVRPGTINRKLSVISKCATYAFKRGWLDKKLEIEWQKESKGRIRFVSEDEERLMYRVFTQLGMLEERDTFKFLIDTGCRLGELKWMEERDLNGDNLTIWRTKNGDPRTIPLTSRAKEIFVQRKGKLSFPQSRISTAWNRVKSAMGLEDDREFVPHCLRHTCASRLVQRGVSILVVKEWLGHKTLGMTMRYSHLCPTNLQAAVKVLEPVTQDVAVA